MNKPKSSQISVETDVEVPMRDGTILRADIYRPESVGPTPVLLHRTPYDKKNYYPTAPGSFDIRRILAAGYTVIVQDVRGRYRSDGKYDSYISPKTHEGEDGYDTVEWAARLPGTTGEVGTFGISYNAWLQFKLAALRPPSLRAMFAISEPMLYTDLEGPGTIRPGRRIMFYANTMAPDYRRRNNLPGTHQPLEADIQWYKIDHEKWLWFLPLLDLPDYVLGSEGEFFRYWLKHPRFEPFRLDKEHRDIAVPNFQITGWYDHCLGIGHHTGMAKHAKTKLARENSKMIIGPWNHVGLGSQRCGDFDFGPEANFDITGALIRWYDYWLKGVPNGVDKEPSVRLFVMGDNKWRSADRWPPGNARERRLFLSSDGHANTPSGNGRLTQRASSLSVHDDYIYDPRDPVMSLYSDRFFTWASDQKPLAYRDDILVYQTGPLSTAIEVIGYPKAILYASSTAPDTDFFARLIDVFPDGRALEVAMGVVRARYRKSFEKPLFLKSGKVTKFEITMGPTSNLFKPGHRVRLDVTSSDFPKYDRNHNTGRDDAADSLLRTANQAVYSGGEFPSRAILPIV